MAIMDPEAIPPRPTHLDDDERNLLCSLEQAVDRGDLDAAHDLAEDLWRGAIDAHRGLFHGLANALTAACAREQGKLEGAVQIAARTRQLLAPYPRRALGLDLAELLDSLDRFLSRGHGPLHLRRRDEP